jgi:hypothetical protein
LDLLPHLLTLPGAVGCTPESYSRLKDLADGINSLNSIPEDTPDSVFRFATLRRSVLDLVDALAAENEIVFVLDDVHALDRPSLDILIDAALASTRRTAMLMATRPIGTSAQRLGERISEAVLRIAGLDPEASREILERDLAPDVAVDRARLIDWAVKLANGNPFCLVELAAHCRGNNPTEELPASLQIALERKLSLLSPTARLVLEACAVLGPYATLSRLDALLALPPHAAVSALSELDSTSLVCTAENRIVCRHEIIADTVVRLIGPTQRAYLHRRCALILAPELQACPVASLAWDCAHHWAAAGENTRALELTLVMADQLLVLGLPNASADLCIRAELYCTSVPQNADRLLRLSRAYRALNNWNGVIETLEARRALGALRVGTPRAEEEYGEDEIALFDARWWRDHDGRLLQPLIRRVIDPRAPTLYRLQMAVVGLVIADNHQRRTDAQRIAETVEAIVVANAREAPEQTRAGLVYHTAFGNLDLARQAAESIVATERHNNASASLLRALRWASITFQYVGEVSTASELLLEGYARAEHLDLTSEMWNSAEYLAGLALDCEQDAIALKWCSVCEDFARQEERTRPDMRIRTQILLSHLALLSGDPVTAMQRLRDVFGPGGNAILRTRVRETVNAIETVSLLRSPGQRVSSSTVARLRRLHLLTRACGTRDFEAGALFLGLLATRRRAEASKLFHEYVDHHRRTRLPMHSVLIEARDRLTLAFA